MIKIAEFLILVGSICGGDNICNKKIKGCVKLKAQKELNIMCAGWVRDTDGQVLIDNPLIKCPLPLRDVFNEDNFGALKSSQIAQMVLDCSMGS